MAQTGFTSIVSYNSATASQVPLAADLTQGELAVNVTDKKVYTKNSGGSVVQVGSGPDATETLTNKTLTSPDINGGTVDGAVIGGTTPAAGSFTTLSATGGITNTAATSTSSYLTGTNGSGVVTSIGVAADNGSLLGTTSSHNLRIATGGAVQATLDTSGNLGLGVTPSAWGGSFKAIELIGGNTITSYPNAGITAMYLGSNAYFNGTNWIYKATSPSAIFTINDNAGVFKWETAPSGTAGNAITFTQAMTLDASGNLLVGRTAQLSGERASFYGPTEAAAFQSANDLTAATILTRSAAAGAGPHYIAAFQTSTGGTVGTITHNDSAVSFNTTSDQRLKENITDADSASSLIDSIQVRQFDWKADNSHQRYGMVAQELALVAPEAVHQPADPDDMMSVDYSKLVPMLVKEIQSLRGRLAALEAK